ncbi:HD domain-containing phosphohydrolase [Butyrivibrio sp. AD3002]|uniref:HD domain-containing phosphohydrolase n=1 Tax=Butyrivibrio sp. AD3002 TaxID=1280670 RepID=UPI0003B681FF|nr:HD domain-containing phosphohydrolase [Butyrivibrio sp. AD3002]
MFEFIRAYQLDIMQWLCAACTTIAFLLFITRFLDRRRKWILIAMEFTATFLLFFDRLSYVYRGDLSPKGVFLVRISNLLVFFLTSQVVFVFNIYLYDILRNVEGEIRIPRRLQFSGAAAAFGMIFSVIAHFTGFYYYFDENNVYHRGPGFLVCYIVPVICPIIQYTAVRMYRKRIARLIYIALTAYIFVPIVVGIIQIFAYGVSIVNMAMVVVSILMYVFSYLDINDTVEKAQRVQMHELREERRSMKRLFDQTATAFVTAVEKKDSFSVGTSERVADCAKRIAEIYGKSAEECDEIYYAALLHDVGRIGIADNLIDKNENLTDEELQIVKQQPVISSEILSSIREYPSLKTGALYCHERYDGTGYPDGLKGKEIPEIARIIAIADAYGAMMAPKSYRDALPYLTVREELIKGSGTQFDPDFTDIMVKILDEDSRSESQEEIKLQKTLKCRKYRDSISVGIPVNTKEREIIFSSKRAGGDSKSFSAPSIILFDSYDRIVHDNQKAIEAYHYLEFGEIWFDGHYISTSAREVEITEAEKTALDGKRKYSIQAAKFEDHLSLQMISPEHIFNVIVALPDKSKAVYIGITGENCDINDIEVQLTGREIKEGDIRKIVGDVSFIERMESDVPNVQVNGFRSASTQGIKVEDGLNIKFHSMTLPDADLVWHCPYIVLFSSEDGNIGGSGYKEYALIKINGEEEEVETNARNKFIMKKKDTFPGWDVWKTENKAGIESEINFIKRGNKITTITENLGIYIENITEVSGIGEIVYAALTGDEVALTDIRIR